MSMITEANTATREYIFPALVNNIWKEVKLLDKLTKKEKRVEGGTRMRTNLEYGTGASGGAYAKTDTLTITPAEISGGAEFPWAHYWAGNSIYIIDELENKGKVQVIDLLVAKMKNIQNTIRDLVETDLFVAQTGNKILSFVDMIEYGTTPIYGGIDRTTLNTWWRGNVTAVNGVLTYAAMETMYNTCSEIPKAPPTLIVTTKALFEYYWKLHLDKVGWLDQNKILETGVVPFGSAEIIYSPKCPTGKMYFINTDHAFLTPHPSDNFAWTGWEDVTAATGQRRLDGRTFWTGNLISDMPASCGVLTGLTTA